MDTEQHNCEICFDKPSVYILAIPCAHNETFCKTCIQNWLAVGQPTCPKCRAWWPESIDSECRICLRRPAISIPLIPCVHKNVFCVECIQCRFAVEQRSCPKCYEMWPENVVVCIVKYFITFICFILCLATTSVSKPDRSYAFSIHSWWFSRSISCFKFNRFLGYSDCVSNCNEIIL